MGPSNQLFKTLGWAVLVTALALPLYGLYDNILGSPFGSGVFFLLPCWLYIFLCLKSLPSRSGKVTLYIFMLVGTLFSALFLSSVETLGLLGIWICFNHSFYHEAFFWRAVPSMVLGALSLLWTLWAWSYSGHALVALWCFLLAQSFYPWVLSTKKQKAKVNLSLDPFDQAFRDAENALENLKGGVMV